MPAPKVNAQTNHSKKMNLPPSGRIPAFNWPTLLALTCVAGLAIALGWVEIFSPDIGFHLNSGRWIWDNMAVPRQNPFVYSAELPYIDLYWLYQMGLWFVYEQAGSIGLVVGNLLLALLCFSVIGLRIWNRESRIPAAFALVLALWVCGSYWEIRPHTISWLWLGLTFLLLENYRRKAGNQIWLVPFVIITWVNCHSLFVLGLVVVGVYAADALLDSRRRTDRRFWLIVGLCALAPFLNPYGLKGVLYPLQQLGMLQSTSAFKSVTTGISEYQSPFQISRYKLLSGEFNLWQPIFAMHVYSGLAVATFLAYLPRANRIEWVIMALFGYIFYSGEKNFGYFFVATAPIVVNRLVSTGAYLQDVRSAFWPGRIVAGLTTAAALLGISQVLNGHYYARLKAPFRVGHSFSSTFLPVGATEFLRNSKIEDVRILNSLDAGGYLAWKTGHPVFIDGLLETFGPHFFQEYTGAKQAKNLPGTVAKWKPDVVLVPYSNIPEWVYYFKDKARWRLVYYDDRDAIFMDPDLASNLPSIGPPEINLTKKNIDAQKLEILLKHNVAQENRSLITCLTMPHYYPSGEIRLSAFHAWCGHTEASLAVALEGLERATSPNADLLLNAGHALFQLKRYPHARYCFEQFLRLDRKSSGPKDPARKLAERRISELNQLQ